MRICLGYLALYENVEKQFPLHKCTSGPKAVNLIREYLKLPTVAIKHFRNTRKYLQEKMIKQGNIYIEQLDRALNYLSPLSPQCITTHSTQQMHDFLMTVSGMPLSDEVSNELLSTANFQGIAEYIDPAIQMPEIQLFTNSENKHERNISFGSTLFAFEPTQSYISTTAIDVEENSAELLLSPLDIALNTEKISETTPSLYFTRKSHLSTTNNSTFIANSEREGKTTTVRNKLKELLFKELRKNPKGNVFTMKNEIFKQLESQLGWAQKKIARVLKDESNYREIAFESLQQCSSAVTSTKKNLSWRERELVQEKAKLTLKLHQYKRR